MKSTKEQRQSWLQLIYDGDEELVVSALNMARTLEDFAELESELASARAVISSCKKVADSVLNEYISELCKNYFEEHP